MNKEKLDAACRQHAKDHYDLNGKVVEVILKNDFKQTVNYTSETWDDGVPVTKMFNRNDDITLYISKGTVLKGITYVGKVSESLIFEFYHNGTWYQEIGASYLFED